MIVENVCTGYTFAKNKRVGHMDGRRNMLLPGAVHHILFFSGWHALLSLNKVHFLLLLKLSFISTYLSKNLFEQCGPKMIAMLLTIAVLKK